MKIFFWALDAPGHVNPALALAKRLARRGHDLHFISGPTTQEHITSHGFEFLLPPFDAYDGPFPPHASMAEVVDSVRALHADLVLCDVLKPVEALVARLAGFQVGFYSVTLPLWSDPIGPPVFSSLPEPRNVAQRLVVRLSWFLNSLRQRRNRWELRRRLPSYRLICDFVESACHSLGFGDADVTWNTTTGVPLPYFPSIPTLVMCPRELDFPRADAGRLSWIGPCVLTERPGAEPPPQFDRRRPLILASLGTQVDGTAGAYRWFQAFCDAVRTRPEWQAIAAVGPQLFPKLVDRSVEGRIAVVPTVAQNKVLENATVAAIHGGINSVKECIMAGVPMAVFPTGVDQFGMAKRIEGKGLGLAGSLQSSPAAIARMLDVLMHDKVRRGRLRAMASTWADMEARDIGALAVESLIA